jgi:hypothetical protein
MEFAIHLRQTTTRTTCDRPEQVRSVCRGWMGGMDRLIQFQRKKKEDTDQPHPYFRIIPTG